jgi:hypothetical protein
MVNSPICKKTSVVQPSSDVFNICFMDRDLIRAVLQKREISCLPAQRSLGFRLEMAEAFLRGLAGRFKRLRIGDVISFNLPRATARGATDLPTSSRCHLCSLSGFEIF